MHWYDETPVSIDDDEGKVLIARYNEQRTANVANPRSHTFGVAMVGPLFRDRFLSMSGDTQELLDKIGGVRIHRALTKADAEVIVVCAVDKTMADMPGTYYVGAVTSPAETKDN